MSDNVMFNEMVRDSVSEDWQDKNWVSSEKLEAANKKMAAQQKMPEEKSNSPAEPAIEIVEKDGTKLHKRISEDYQNIWESFLMNTEADFKKYMGYGKEEIEKIGIVKFIDAYDWRNAADVFSWKTDKIHIIICAHCKNEFVPLELQLGLCKECQELYDLEKLENVIRGTSEDAAFSIIQANGHKIPSNIPNMSLQCLGLFISDPEVRTKFLKKPE